MADVNGDGLLDIYICRVGNYEMLHSKNQLLICQGIDKNGVPYYKDEANRFYLICGNAPFVTCAYKCSWDTARFMYFDEWVNLDQHSEDEKQFLTDVWNKYAQFAPLVDLRGQC